MHDKKIGAEWPLLHEYGLSTGMVFELRIKWWTCKRWTLMSTLQEDSAVLDEERCEHQAQDS